MKKAIFLIVLIFCWHSFSQNILISSEGNPTEPSITIHPDNNDILVAVSALRYYHTSTDGGQTWQTNTINSSYGVWGDPVIDVDREGIFYFTHLSNTSGGSFIDRIVCQTSSDNGNSWNDGSFTGLNGSKAQDKQWSIIDDNNVIYLTWTQFDKYGSADPEDKSAVIFSKSMDKGVSWSTPIEINEVYGDCLDSDNTLVGAVPALGPNNELYVAWAGPNGLVFNRSLDGGVNWLDSEIQVSDMPSGWNIDIPGIFRANGLPITKCDTSGGAHNGTIYLNWADQRNGTDNTDIWLTKSTDKGNSWSDPIKVNTDNGDSHQFFTWMDIDQTNGHLYFVFYDRRNYNDTRTDVFLARSTDGGQTFENYKISESPFVPDKGIFFGDYNNIIAHDNIIRPIWTRLHEGQLSIWTDVTPLDNLLNIEEEEHEQSSSSLIAYPNPGSKKVYISFKLRKNSKVKLALYDSQGKLISSLIDNQNLEYGKQIVPIDVDDMQLSSGIYYYRLTIDNIESKLKKLIVD